MIRNPYDLEVSMYHYLRLGHKYDAGHAQNLAISGDFEKFCNEARYVGRNPSDIQVWYLLGERLLPNMRIIRFEGLELGLRSAIGEFLPEKWSMPRENSTKHESYRSYLTVNIERAIYRKYSWVFDMGFYSRDPIAQI